MVHLTAALRPLSFSYGPTFELLGVGFGKGELGMREAWPLFRCARVRVNQMRN
jgi:hypothetical protein